MSLRLAACAGRREQFCDTVDRMTGDVGEDGAEIGFGSDAVQLAGFGERVDGGGAFTAGVGACEESVFSAECDASDGAFSIVVVDFGAAVIDIAVESGPAAEGIAHGLGENGLGR